MTATSITVGATLQPDGMTLHLEKKLALPPGQVAVTLQPTTAISGPTMLEVLERIHRDQVKRGRKAMTEEQMAAEIAQIRAGDDEYQKRLRQIDTQTMPKVPDGN